MLIRHQTLKKRFKIWYSICNTCYKKYRKNIDQDIYLADKAYDTENIKKDNYWRNNSNTTNTNKEKSEKQEHTEQNTEQYSGKIYTTSEIKLNM